MPTIQIKNVSAATHEVLVRRAAAANKSLQAYLFDLLTEQASQPTLDETLRRISGHDGGSAPNDVVLGILRDDRDRH